MKIAFITDIHLDEQQVSGYGVAMRSNWERLLHTIAGQEPDMVIFGGDIGTASSHGYFAGSLAKFRQVRLLLGNHDRLTDVQANMPHLARGQQSQNFTETIGGKISVFLDSSSGRIDDSQIRMLGQALLNHSELMLFVHHPVLSVSNYVDTHYPLKNRDVVQQLIFDSGCAVTVFCGHYHMADKRKSQNITQYITPAASYQIAKTDKLKPDPTHFGFRIIEVGEDIQTHCVLLDQ